MFRLEDKSSTDNDWLLSSALAIPTTTVESRQQYFSLRSINEVLTDIISSKALMSSIFHICEYCWLIWRVFTVWFDRSDVKRWCSWSVLKKHCLKLNFSKFSEILISWEIEIANWSVIVNPSQLKENRGALSKGMVEWRLKEVFLCAYIGSLFACLIPR